MIEISIRAKTLGLLLGGWAADLCKSRRGQQLLCKGLRSNSVFVEGFLIHNIGLRDINIVATKDLQGDAQRSGSGQPGRVAQDLVYQYHRDGESMINDRRH